MKITKLNKGRLRKLRAAMMVAFAVNACIIGGITLLFHATLAFFMAAFYLAAVQGLILVAIMVIDAFLKEAPYCMHSIDKDDDRLVTTSKIKRAEHGDFLVLDSADLLPSVSFLRYQERREDLTIIVEDKKNNGGVTVYE